MYQNIRTKAGYVCWKEEVPFWNLITIFIDANVDIEVKSNSHYNVVLNEKMHSVGLIGV